MQTSLIFSDCIGLGIVHNIFLDLFNRHLKTKKKNNISQPHWKSEMLTLEIKTKRSSGKGDQQAKHGIHLSKLFAFLLLSKTFKLIKLF